MLEKIKALGNTLFSRPMPLLVSAGFLLTMIIMISKVAVVDGVQPLELAFATSLGAGLILLCIVAARSDLPTWTPANLVLYFVLGIVSFGYPNIITFVVVHEAGPAFGSMVYALSPLFTFVIAASFGVEAMSLFRGLGIVTGLVGTVLVVSQKAGFGMTDEIFWALLGLTIPASLAMGNVIRTAFWPQNTSPASFASAALLVSALQLLAMGFILEKPVTWIDKNPIELLWIAAIILTAAIFYLLLFRLQRIAGPVFLSQVGYWATGLGVIASALIFGDLIGLISIGGVGLIIAGSVLARKIPKTA